MRRSARVVVMALVTASAATAAFGVGRATGPPPPDLSSHDDGAYFDGVRAGRAQGRMEGRAAQEGIALPPGDRAPVQDAFTAGYASGLTDAFAGFDGGWTLHVPWIVTLDRGPGQVSYRIAHRTAIEPGVD